VRVWDVSAGYLNRQSLLGEHRELHGLHNILTLGRRGYSRHPETLRWVDRTTALACRHALLTAEMRLRGYVDRTPLPIARLKTVWPDVFIDEPWAQFELLRGKYVGRPPGRIPLPRTPHELWAHHKYSVLARDPARYREFGRIVARFRRGAPLEDLARALVLELRERPSYGTLANAIEHMWGHVNRRATADEARAAQRSSARMFAATQAAAVRESEPYLLASTALSELDVDVRRAAVRVTSGPGTR
jgi:hypothetical protein